MSSPDPTTPVGDEERDRRGDERRDRLDAEYAALMRKAKAEAAVKAIAEGANPTWVAFTLSNEFTDELTRSLRRRLGLWFGRRR